MLQSSSRTRRIGETMLARIAIPQWEGCAISARSREGCRVLHEMLLRRGLACDWLELPFVDVLETLDSIIGKARLVANLEQVGQHIAHSQPDRIWTLGGDCS